MRFIADRKSLLKICRNLARILPDTSPIADLTGILLEADENTGAMRLTANNMEIAIQYECPASVGESGKMVLNGSLLANLLPLLAGEQVLFDTQNDGVVHIQSQSTSYHLSYLPGSHYPKPEIPMPESMVQISGIGRLAKQTLFAAKKAGADAGVLANVKLEVYPSEMHMIGTDGMRLAMARHKQEAAGRMTLLIPASSLAVLASIAEDEAVQAGLSTNTLVFVGSGFVFTSRTAQGVSLDVNELLGRIALQYDALVPARDLWRSADNLGVVADSTSLFHLILQKDGIRLSYQGENSGFQTTMEALIYRPTPKTGFYYSVNYFLQALRYMEGNIQLGIDKAGVLLLKSEDQCYMLTPMRPRKAAAKETGKKKENEKITAKAA